MSRKPPDTPPGKYAAGSVRKQYGSYAWSRNYYVCCKHDARALFFLPTTALTATARPIYLATFKRPIGVRAFHMVVCMEGGSTGCTAACTAKRTVSIIISPYSREWMRGKKNEGKKIRKCLVHINRVILTAAINELLTIRNYRTRTQVSNNSVLINPVRPTRCWTIMFYGSLCVPVRTTFFVSSNKPDIIIRYYTRVYARSALL